MESGGSPGHGAEQRTLASVMFTDVVGFSKHSAINEERTYAALNRDFDLIYAHVAAHGGQVLNTMGDGMMVVFMSAIDCLRCARAIQEGFHQQTITKPENGILQHRIGIHVGDIILNGRNTMGDTVNQAARIQSLARPDSIAMSRDFHDLIKGKTGFDIKYLGPRMTRNIPVPIPIHEIPPIDDAMRQQVADSLFIPPPSEVRREATGRKGLAFLLGAIVLLVAAAAPIFWLASVSKNAKNQGIVVKPGSYKDDPGSLKKLREAFKQNGGDQNAPTDANTPDSNAPDPNTPTSNQAVAFALKPSDLTQIEGLLSNHDYVGIVTLLKAVPGSNAGEGVAMVSKYEGLVKFSQWLQNEVNASTDQMPIVASIEGFDSRIYTSAGAVIIAANNQTSAPKDLWQWKNSTILTIAEACATTPPTKNPAPAEVATWIATFREVHRS